MKSQEKITVSENWTKEERTKIAEAINSALEQINNKEQETRERVKWEAPCFEEWKRKREDYHQMLEILKAFDPIFLEANRRNFSEFIVC